MNPIEQMMNTPLADGTPPDTVRLHNHYLDFLREVLLLAGKDLNPADVDFQLTATMLGISEKALKRWTDSSFKTVSMVVSADIQPVDEAMAQAIRLALQIGARMGAENERARLGVAA